MDRQSIIAHMNAEPVTTAGRWPADGWSVGTTSLSALRPLRYLRTRHGQNWHRLIAMLCVPNLSSNVVSYRCTKRLSLIDNSETFFFLKQRDFQPPKASFLLLGKLPVIGSLFPMVMSHKFSLRQFAKMKSRLSFRKWMISFRSKTFDSLYSIAIRRSLL